ncbi:hypothetical protein C1X64_23985 [Pseudomonas sp. GW456-E7]|nr:hypothetical protein C1X64_23985 [Pseudomonas sp. GW456-E7]
MATHKVTRVDGELDPTFAIGGKFEVPTPTEDAVSLIADTDTGTESLTVAMNAGQEFCLCRADKNGVLDTSFANQGWLKWRFQDGKNSAIWRALVQPLDKKIVVIGASFITSGTAQPALTRFNSNGSPDLVFGRVVLPVFPESHTSITRVRGCLQSDGKILVCGGYLSNSGSKTLLIRLLADGTMDTSFGKDGVVELTHPNGMLYPEQVEIQGSGRILVAGYFWRNQGFVVGVGTDGNVDKDFGNQGFVLIEAQDVTTLNNLLVLKDGRLRCIGGTGSSGALLVGLDENGNPDPSFNEGKPVKTKELLGRWVTIREQDDHMLLVAGHSGGALIEQVCARFSPQGALDRAFGWSGFMYHPGGPADSVIQPGGRWITTAQQSNSTLVWLYGMVVGGGTPLTNSSIRQKKAPH